MNVHSENKLHAALLIALLMVFVQGQGLARQRIVGYYAAYKSTIPYDSVEYSNLTDIIVSSVYLDTDGSLQYKDPRIPFPQLVDSAHKAGVKVLISIGGGNATVNACFPIVTADSATRRIIIHSIVTFLDTNDYDGVDIDWETPANAQQGDDLASLVREMRAKFNQVDPSWLITMAIPGWHIGAAFDYTDMDSYVDWYNVMCYDYMASWCYYAGHDSPLYESPNDPNGAGSDSATIHYLILRGIPRSKLVLGVPFYGDVFRARGLYKPGTFVGSTSYSENMNYIASGWHYNWDSVSEVPYLISPDSTRFISFEDTNSIKLKTEFAIREGLGGIMIWELSKDMYDGHQPLLEEIANTMRRLRQLEGKK